MRNTRLFIYKEPIIHNTSISYTPISGGGYYDNYWTIPSATTFAIYGMIPYADDLAGTYAIHQNFGLDDVAIVKIGVVVDASTAVDGAFDIGVGNSHYTIVQPGTYIFTFDVTSPDATFNFDIVIHGSGGAYLGGNPVSGMGIKEIYLISAQTQQYKEVDLYDNLDIPITYNVADVQDITKKDSNFSLTVQLPNTANNALLFDQVKDIAVYGSSFEMLKQYPAFVEVDGNRTFEGYLQITKVVTNDDQEVIYECNLFSNFVEFVSRLSTTTLRGNANPLDDLSFSEYTTQLTVITDPNDPNYPGEWFNRTDMYYWDTSTTPWTPISEKPYGEDFYFAPVDKFCLGTRHSVSVGGEKYVPFFYDELTPFLFVKEIWDKIFEQAGFSYVSDFIEDTNNTTTFQFDHLVYPATNYKIGTEQDIFSVVKQTSVATVYDPLNRHIYGKLLGAWSGSVPTYVTDTDIPTFFDQYTQCSVAESNAGSTVFSSSNAYRYTFPTNGVYNVNMSLPIRAAFYMTNANGSILPGLLQTTVNADTSAQFFYELNLIWHDSVNNTDTVIAKYGRPSLTNYSSSYDRGWNGSFIVDEGVFNYNADLYVNANDYLWFTARTTLQEKNGGTLIFYDTNDTNTRWPHKLHLEIKRESDANNLPVQLIDIRLVSDFYINSTFNPTIILNPNTKKVDFINNIIKKFNLYVEDVTNKKDTNGVYYRDYTTPNVRKGEPILRIEPRPLYYSNNQVVRDWTSKVDVSTMNFARIDDYLYNRLIFNDKNDETYNGDFYNKYNYTSGEYGEQIITSPFSVDEDKKTEVLTTWGQTCCGSVATSDISMQQNTYFQCPYIFTLDDSGLVKEDKEYNDRMLFVYNLYWADYTDIWNDSKLKGYQLFERDNAHPGQFTTPFNITVRSYCLLDTFNQPFGSKTADINYGWANWYYQNLNGTWATDKNCYNVFYADMVESYNDPSARLLKCNIYLSPSDIRDLQLSDTIILNNMAYHINKIDQWHNGEEPCKVELIKIIDSQSTTPINILRQNNPPKIDIVTPVMIKGEVAELSKDVAAVEKVVEDNKEELASNTKAIAQIEQVLKNFDERLKKLEG